MRRSLLLVFIICLAIFTILPVAASSPSSTYLPAAPRPAQQYGLMNDNQFACPTATTAQAGYGNRATEIKVNLNAKKAQSQANHGEIPVGVVGVLINEDGTIATVYPPSNLRLFGIISSDRVFAVEGQKVDFYRFEDQCRGVPGQLRNLTIVHNGQVTKIAVPLIDVDKVLSYNRNYQRSASMAVHW